MKQRCQKIQHDEQTDQLKPFQLTIYIVCTELCGLHYSAPDRCSNSIIKKVNVMFNVGGITVSTSPPLVNDWVDVSNRSLKRLRFRLPTHAVKLLTFITPLLHVRYYLFIFDDFYH